MGKVHGYTEPGRRNFGNQKKSLPRCFSEQKMSLPRCFSEQKMSLPRSPPARPRIPIHLAHPLTIGWCVTVVAKFAMDLVNTKFATIDKKCKLTPTSTAILRHFWAL